MGFLGQLKLQGALRKALVNPKHLPEAKKEIDEFCSKHSAGEATAVFTIAFKPIIDRPGVQFLMFKWIALNAIKSIQGFGLVDRTKAEAFSDFKEVLSVMIAKRVAVESTYLGAFCAILEEEFSGQPLQPETEKARAALHKDLLSYAPNDYGAFISN